MSRFWHHAAAEQDGDTWNANLPLFSIDKPLWVYANILYPLKESVTGAGYYYRPYTAEAFNLSSQMHAASPRQLEAAGVKATAHPSLVIETFDRDWEKEWFTYKPESWDRHTHKIYDDRWKAPADAKFAFGVRSPRPNVLVVGIDEFGVEIAIEDGDQWQSVTLAPTDFRDANGDALPNWDDAHELRLGSTETLRSRGTDSKESRVLGGPWEGSKPEFRNLRWIGGDSNDYLKPR